jgi:hypothetical protein
MMKNPMNLEFEPEHPKNALLASVVHEISCLLFLFPDAKIVAKIGIIFVIR